MKVLVTGSRSWSDFETIFDALACLPSDSIIVHGANRRWSQELKKSISADYLAGVAAQMLGLEVREYPVTPEDWKRYGLRAGILRNETMLVKEEPELVLAFRMAGKSSGTDHMMRTALTAGRPVELRYLDHLGQLRFVRATHWQQIRDIIA